MSVNSSIFAGAAALHAGFTDEFGILSGFADLEAADTGVVSGLRRVKGVQTVPFPSVSPTRAVIPGDDGPMGSFSFTNGDLATGQIEMATADAEFEAAQQNSQVWSVNGVDIGVRGSRLISLENMAVLVHQKAKSQDDDTAGEEGFMNYLMPNTTMSPIGPESAAYQAAGNVRYDAVFDPFYRIPTGDPMDDTTFNVEDGTLLWWWSQYPSFFDVKVGDELADTIVTTYTPVSAATTRVTLVNLATGVMSVATVSSVGPGKLITLSANIADTHKAIAMYQTRRFA